MQKDLERIKTYLKDTGMKPSRLGLLACANARAVERVLSGTGSVETLQKLIQYIDNNPIKKTK